MQLAKVSSKGQITVPKLIRDLLDIKTGDKVAFHLTDQGVITVSKGNLSQLMIKN